MSGQVASHTTGLPELHGTRDMPSGLTSQRPGGSSLDGEDRVQCMMSLTAACREKGQLQLDSN